MLLKRKRSNTRNNVQKQNQANSLAQDQDNVSPYKFVDRGAYGCVFKPALPCVGKGSAKTEVVEKESMTISKVFHIENDYKEELETIKFVNKIDPHHEWSLPLISACKANASTAVSRSELLKCPYITPSGRSKMLQLVIPYGGIALNKVIESGEKLSVSLFLFTLHQLLKAVKNFQEYGYAHLDIKPHNVLLNTQVADEPKAYLIDYSLVTPLNVLYDSNMHYIMTRRYLWYPPEYYIYIKLRTYLKDFGKDVQLSRMVTDIGRLCTKSMVIYDEKKYGVSFSNKAYEEEHKQLVDFVTDVISKIDSTEPKNKFNKLRALFEEYVNVFDVYSVGVVMLNMLQSMSHTRSKTFDHLTSLLKRMMSASPIKRPSVDECISFIHIEVSRSAKRFLKK